MKALVLIDHVVNMHYNSWYIISTYFSILFVSCEKAALWVVPSVHLSVRASFTHFPQCPSHRTNSKFSGVITIDKNYVHTKGHDQRLKVNVTEVKTNFTQFGCFRTITTVWIYVFLRNDAQSQKWHRKGVLLFFKVIRQIFRFNGPQNRRFWLELSVSGLYLHFKFTDDYEMTHKAWRDIEEVRFYFFMSSVKFQGHTGRKMDWYDPDWAFPDCNSRFKSQMTTK